MFEVHKSGKFSLTITSAELASGLRKLDSNPRGTASFTALAGMVGKDNALRSLSQMTRIDTDVITDTFPYPQLFVLSNHILICGERKIYEYVGAALVLKITASEAGRTWRILDYVDYLCLSNGVVTITRNPQTGAYSESATLPIFEAGCDYNGQAVIGDIIWQ